MHNESNVVVANSVSSVIWNTTNKIRAFVPLGLLIVGVILTAMFPVTVLLPTIGVLMCLFQLEYRIALILGVVLEASGDCEFIAVIAIFLSLALTGLLIYGMYHSHDLAQGISLVIRDAAIATPHALTLAWSGIIGFFHHALFG